MTAKEIEAVDQWWINRGIPAICELSPEQRPEDRGTWSGLPLTVLV